MPMPDDFYMSELFPEDFFLGALEVALTAIFRCGDLEGAIKKVAEKYEVVLTSDVIAGIVKDAWDIWNSTDLWTIQDGKAVPK